MTGNLVSLPTVTAIWRVSQGTVRRRVAKGLLEPVYEPGPVRAPRYREADVMALAWSHGRPEQLELPV